MHLSPAELAFFYGNFFLSFSLQIITALLIFRRREARTFPVFFAYTIFHVVQGLLSIIAYRISYTFYFYEWWTGEILDAVVTLAVIQEVFVVTFRPYDALRRWGTRLYIGCALLLCVLVLAMSNLHSHGESSPRVLALFVLQRSAAVVQIGLVAFLFLFCRLFGLTSRHYVFGIASGFALMAGVYAVVGTIRTYYGPSINSWTGTLEAATFTASVIIWTYYFGSAKSRVLLDQVPGTERLVAWNRALSDIGRR